MQDRAPSTRREFLRRSAALGAASFAVPYLIPRDVLAAPGKAGANDRIGVAGIGIGRQGSGDLAQALKSRDTQFIAIADVNRKRAAAIAEKNKGTAYQDYRKLLERKDVDAIVTATPDHWRALVCVHACQAGKDIYAEKPVSLTIREGRVMVEAARKYQRVFQVGSQQRSDLIDQAASKFVREGGMGKVAKVEIMNFPSPFECGLPGQPVPEEIDWDMWCGPTEPVPYHLDLYTPRAKPGWISFRPYSGGEMTGWGAHGFDQIQTALGMDGGGPVEVWVEGGKFNPPTITEPEKSARANKICSEPKVHFRYANGVVIESVATKAPGFGGIFHCEKGTITIDRGVCKSDPPEIAKDIIKSIKNTCLHVENWIACIKSREKPNADIEIGHRSATICHMGNIARWTGRKLHWDPVKERFDEAEANEHLDRRRRKPYALPETI